MPAQVQAILSGLFGGSSQEGSLVYKLERMRESARGRFRGRAARKKQGEFAATVRRNSDDAAAQSRMRWTRVLGLLRLLSPGGRVTAGQVLFDGEDLMALSERDLRSVRGKRAAIVFQGAMSALNPVHR